MLALSAMFFLPKCKPALFGFLRSKKAAVITFGGGGLWFLYILSKLTEADFGEFKIYLIAIFGAAGLLGELQNFGLPVFPGAVLR